MSNLRVYVCVAARRGKTDLVGEGTGDVISGGECYTSERTFTLISHTHNYAIHFVHTHADAPALCSRTHIQTHTWCSAVQGLSGELVMVHRERFDR